MRRMTFAWLLLAGGAAVGPSVSAEAPAAAKTDSIPTVLQDYVARPEPDFKWEIKSRPDNGRGGVYTVELTSQTWQGIQWKHWLYIFEPAEIEFPDKMLIYATGGEIGKPAGVADTAMGLRLAQVAGARVAFLFQVPNQPLLDGRVEDDLITETFLKFLATKDPTWPCLFPMVKSVVKAMDAVQAIAKSEWNQPVDGFVVTGASKRGWTSWLTAVADKRVVGVAPIVIDMLNTLPQMRYQMETWGEYSEQIKDYTSKGLVKLLFQDPNVPLWRWMDPYTYRQQLTLPKLIINGTNDPYWVVDAMNNYWDGLLGPKYVLYVPNAGHGLEGGRDEAMGAMGGFFRHVAARQAMPRLKWKHDDGASGPRLTVSSEPAAEEAFLWTATSPTKDFRKAKWESQPMSASGGGFVGEIAKPAGMHVALFGQLRLKEKGPSYSLSTQLRRD